MDDQTMMIMAALAVLTGVIGLFFLRTAQVIQQAKTIDELRGQVTHATEMLEATQRQMAFDKRNYEMMLAEKDTIIKTRSASLSMAQTAAKNLKIDVDMADKHISELRDKHSKLVEKAVLLDFIVENKLNLDCYKDKPGSKVFLWRVVEHDPESAGKLHTIGNGATVAAAISSAFKKLNERKKK